MIIIAYGCGYYCFLIESHFLLEQPNDPLALNVKIGTAK